MCPPRRPGKSPSWNGARILECWSGGTPRRNTSVSVPRLTPDRTVRTTTSAGPGSGRSNGQLSPRSSARSRNACAIRRSTFSRLRTVLTGALYRSTRDPAPPDWRSCSTRQRGMRSRRTLSSQGSPAREETWNVRSGTREARPQTSPRSQQLTASTEPGSLARNYDTTLVGPEGTSKSSSTRSTNDTTEQAAKRDGAAAARTNAPDATGRAALAGNSKPAST